MNQGQGIEWSWVDFELGENVVNEALDAQWKDALIDGRKHVSNRELALSHAQEFILGIQHFQILECLVDAILRNIRPLFLLNDYVFRIIIEFALPGQGPLVPFIFRKLSSNKLDVNPGQSELPFRVCVRKRPLLLHEEEAGGFDTVQANYNHLLSDKRSTNSTVTTHDGRLARNGRILTINHRSYTFDRVWDEHTSNDQICADEVAPLVQWAMRGNSSTILYFGQTGTGKTFTLSGALDYICESLKGKAVEVKVYEIHGKKCYDLLNSRKVVFLRSDENENVHLRGARIVKFTVEESKGVELRKVFQSALTLRSSQVTERNPISSRSHAIFEIKVISSSLSYCESVSNEFGVLSLVDLAGSERNFDTLKMSAAEHRESADINYALMALKDCFRNYYLSLSGSAHRIIDEGTKKIDYKKILSLRPVTKAPYRASQLTRVLRSCFCSSSSESRHLTTIVATVSPNSTDIQHTINTLDHVAMMIPLLYDEISGVVVEIPMTGAPLSHIPVECWTSAQLTQWLATADGGKFSQLALPPNVDGATLMSLDLTSISALFSGTLRQARQGEEGVAWVVDSGPSLELDQESGNDITASAATTSGGGRTTRSTIIGRSLWAALRREQLSAAYRSKTVVV